MKLGKRSTYISAAINVIKRRGEKEKRIEMIRRGVISGF